MNSASFETLLTSLPSAESTDADPLLVTFAFLHILPTSSPTTASAAAAAPPRLLTPIDPLVRGRHTYQPLLQLPPRTPTPPHSPTLRRPFPITASPTLEPSRRIGTRIRYGAPAAAGIPQTSTDYGFNRCHFPHNQRVLRTRNPNPPLHRRFLRHQPKRSSGTSPTVDRPSTTATFEISLKVRRALHTR